MMLKTRTEYDRFIECLENKLAWQEERFQNMVESHIKFRSEIIEAMEVSEAILTRYPKYTWSTVEVVGALHKFLARLHKAIDIEYVNAD
jgi:hypothetical protein